MDRVKTIGEQLLCPLLVEASRGLRGGSNAAAQASKHRDLLRYVVAQLATAGGGKSLHHTFPVAWGNACSEGQAALEAAPQPELSHLTASVELNLSGASSNSVVMEVPGPSQNRFAAEQTALLPSDDLRWLEKRQSTKAFIELRRLNVFAGADDFNEVVVGLGVESPSCFPKRFWHAAFGLFLWGRAQKLRPVLEEELRRRLPPNSSYMGQG